MAKQVSLLNFIASKRKNIADDSLPEDVARKSVVVETEASSSQATVMANSPAPSSSKTYTLTPLPSKKKSKASSYRSIRINTSKFQTVWLKEFIWLKFENELMFCTYCIAANNNNVLTKGCQEFLKDILIKHGRSKDHRNAITTKHCAKDFQLSCTKAYSKEKEAIIAAMHSAYYLAKKHCPIDEMKDLVTLQIYQVL